MYRVYEEQFGLFRIVEVQSQVTAQMQMQLGADGALGAFGAQYGLSQSAALTAEELERLLNRP